MVDERANKGEQEVSIAVVHQAGEHEAVLQADVKEGEEKELEEEEEEEEEQTIGKKNVQYVQNYLLRSRKTSGETLARRTPKASCSSFDSSISLLSLSLSLLSLSLSLSALQKRFTDTLLDL